MPYAPGPGHTNSIIKNSSKLLFTFENGLYPDNVCCFPGPDLVSNCLTKMELKKCNSESQFEESVGDESK